ncbi:MAG: VWA domain-containing protein [Planctomycetes bacterium]|nr:VWA domain-containing protein [Planctomycetota bacterium]
MMNAVMPILASINEETRAVLEFAGLPQGWGRLFAFALLIGLCYGVVWLYRREGRAGSSPRIRTMLAAMRCAVLLLLAGVWLEPVIATYVRRTSRAATIVLVDTSTSMTIADEPRDGGEGQARLDGVRRLLGDDQHAWLHALAARNDLAIYTFGADTRRVRLPWENAASQPTSASMESIALDDALSAIQSHTDIGQALLSALGNAGDGPVAGVVLFSDGQINQGLEAEDLASQVRNGRTHLYTVGVGQDVEPPNVRVASISAPATAARGDPIEIRVEVSAAGIEAAPLKLELLSRRVGDAGDSERVVATREVVVGGDRGVVEERFRVETDSEGEFVYRARVTPPPQDIVPFDNIRSASVLVLDDKLRVLIVAGRPTYDYRAVTALLSRDKTIDLSCWLQSADANALRDGTTVIDDLPRKPEALFAYDVVLLMDPDPRELDSSWAVNVRRLVDELGGGLLLQAGSFYTARFLRDERLTDLVSILPIAPDPDADVRLSERGAFHTQATALRVPDDARGHPVLQLHPDATANRAIWESLVGAWWYLPVLREKPLAAVLLRGAAAGAASLSPERGEQSSSLSPLLMTAQPFGAGRTLYLGFDGTWRWRANAERYFNRFWIQVVRYLAQARRQGVSRRGTIVLDRESYEVDQVGRIEARVLDPAFAPLQEPAVEAEIETADGRREPLSLSAIPGREGWYAGKTTFEQEGPTLVRIPLSGGGGAKNEALVKHAQVQRPDVEMRALRLRADVLTRLAEQSEGKYVPLAQARDLPNEIANASQIRTIPGPRRALWDRGWVMTVLAALLCVEWFIRRRNHLL